MKSTSIEYGTYSTSKQEKIETYQQGASQQSEEYEYRLQKREAKSTSRVNSNVNRKLRRKLA